MKIGNLDGRLVLVRNDQALDVATASDGRFGPEPQSVYERWTEFTSWAENATGGLQPIEPARLGPPAPAPRQVLAIGFNYLDHADEAHTEAPKHPMVFTKFASCLAGPDCEVRISERMLVDWEVELVAVIGEEARHVPIERAWDHVAGLTVGQDLSDRRLQMRKPSPEQYSLGKSRPGFGPIGPYLVTPDELDDRMDLGIECTLSGERVQASRTSRMLFTVPDLVARLSATLPLLPGDVLFTGTPAGVGAMRNPQRWIQPGEKLVSTIEGLGSILTTFVADD